MTGHLDHIHEVCNDSNTYYDNTITGYLHEVCNDSTTKYLIIYKYAMIATHIIKYSW